MGQPNRLTDLAERLRDQFHLAPTLPQEPEESTRRKLRVSRRAPAEPNPILRKPRRSAASSRTYEQRSIPPVMVRGNLNPTMPSRTAGRSKARRHVIVPLNMPGAEMQLPALPMIEINARTLSGLAAAVLIALLVYFWNSPAYQVEAAQIGGLQSLSTHDVNIVLDLDGEMIFSINPQTIEQNLRESFPEFISVSASVSLPNQVNIQVTERQPLIAWKLDGRTILVDANGYSFPQRDGRIVETQVTVDALSAPPALVSSQEVQIGAIPFLPVEMVSAIISMSAQVPPGAPLIYDAQHGLGWVDAQGWEVYFGDVQDIDIKLRLYSAMVDMFKKEGTTPVLVSVEYVHAPYYRLER